MVKIHKLSSRLFQTFPSLHLSRSQMKKRKSLGRGKGDNGSDRKRHFFFSIFFFFFLPWTGVSSFCVSMPIHGTELASLSSPVWRGGKEKKVPRSCLLDSAHFDKQASKRDRRKRKRGEGEAEAEEVGGVCGCKLCLVRQRRSPLCPHPSDVRRPTVSASTSASASASTSVSESAVPLCSLFPTHTHTRTHLKFSLSSRPWNCLHNVPAARPPPPSLLFPGAECGPPYCTFGEAPRFCKRALMHARLADRSMNARKN